MTTETLNAKQAAAILHCSANLACELARKGEIPAVQIAGQWLFVREQLLDWLKQRAREEQAKRRETAAAIALTPHPDPIKRERGRPRKTTLDLSKLV